MMRDGAASDAIIKAIGKRAIAMLGFIFALLKNFQILAYYIRRRCQCKQIDILMMRNAIGEEIPILCVKGSADHNVSHHCLQKVGLAHHQKVSTFNMSYMGL